MTNKHVNMVNENSRWVVLDGMAGLLDEEQYAIQYTAVQSQKAVSAHFTSEQILPFDFAKQYTPVSLSMGYFIWPDS